MVEISQYITVLRNRFTLVEKGRCSQTQLEKIQLYIFLSH